MQKTPTKRSIKTLDFNCDLAQGYGVYKNNSEYELKLSVCSILLLYLFKISSLLFILAIINF